MSGADALRDAVGAAGAPARDPGAGHFNDYGLGLIGGGRAGFGGGSSSSGAGAQHLLRLAAVAIDGDAFAAQGVGGLVGFRHIRHAGIVREVDGFGNGIVGVFLESGLHPHVPAGVNVVGHAENILDPTRNPVQIVQRPRLRQPFHQLRGVKSFVPGYRLKVGVAFHQPRAVHHIPHIRQGKQGFNPAGGAGDDADGAGRRNGHRGGVPHPPGIGAAAINAAFPFRERAPPFRQLLRGAVGFLPDEPHHCPGQLQRFLAVVAHPQLDEHIRPAHHAQADAPGAPAHIGNLRDGVVVHINHAVQHMNGGGDDFGHTRPVRLGVVIGVPHHTRQVERPQVAGFVGQQGLLAAVVDIKAVGVKGIDAGHGHIKDVCHVVALRLDNMSCERTAVGRRLRNLHPPLKAFRLDHCVVSVEVLVGNQQFRVSFPVPNTGPDGQPEQHPLQALQGQLASASGSDVDAFRIFASVLTVSLGHSPEKPGVECTGRLLHFGRYGGILRINVQPPPDFIQQCAFF